MLQCMCACACVLVRVSIHAYIHARMHACMYNVYLRCRGAIVLQRWHNSGLGHGARGTWSRDLLCSAVFCSALFSSLTFVYLSLPPFLFPSLLPSLSFSLLPSLPPSVPLSSPLSLPFSFPLLTSDQPSHLSFVRAPHMRKPADHAPSTPCARPRNIPLAAAQLSKGVLRGGRRGYPDPRLLDHGGLRRELLSACAGACASACASASLSWGSGCDAKEF